MANRIQIRRDTALNWLTSQSVRPEEPLLFQGEIGWEIDSNKIKIGDGNNKWEDLPYFTASDLPPNDLGYLKNDGNGGLTWEPNQQVNSDWNASFGPAAILNKPDIPRDVNELTDVNQLLTPELVRTLEETITDLLPFDFGTIVPRTIRNRLEWLLQVVDVDNGTINSPANADYDAGTLI